MTRLVWWAERNYRCTTPALLPLDESLESPRHSLRSRTQPSFPPWESQPAATERQPKLALVDAQGLRRRVTRAIVKTFQPNGAPCPYGTGLHPFSGDLMNTNNHIHSDIATPVRSLLCCCCGGRLEGRQFFNQDTGHGLGDCCVSYVKSRTPDDMERTYGVDGVHYNLDPLARVYSLSTPGAFETWRIAQNLTDRWGEINTSGENVSTKLLLQADADLMDRLQLQMFDEDTFIVRKDGAWGVLFELEFCSRESEANIDTAEENAKRPARDVVIANLIADLQELQLQFPGVHFAVPDPVHIYEGRPAAWAFVPEGLLDEPQREALGRALQSMHG